MPYIPSIHDYKPFYIQTENDATAWDTTTYGMVAQTQPFPDNCEVKEPYKNDWHDEHGDDEYVVDLYRKAFELTVKFYIKAYAYQGATALSQLQELKTAFRNKLIPGEFKIYDSWQEKGFRGVRFVKDEVEQRDITDEVAWMIFSVTFKVNDPYSNVYMDNNSIVSTA